MSTEIEFEALVEKAPESPTSTVRTGKRPVIPALRNTNRVGMDIRPDPVFDNTSLLDSDYFAKIKAEVLADGQNYMSSKEPWGIYDDDDEAYDDEYIERTPGSRAYSSRTSVYNTTGLPITMVHRNNMKFLLPNESAAGVQSGVHGILIETVYSLTTTSLRAFVKTMVANPRKYSKQLLEALTNKLRERTEGHSMMSEHFNFTSKVIIPYDVIASERLVYNSRTDYAFFCGEPHRAPDHPLYGDAFVDDVYKGFFVKEASISSVIDIVDNENTISGNKFVHMLGEVIPVKVRRDPVLASGIYLITRKNIDDEAETKIFPLSEGVDVGVYSSMEEAQAGGDVSATNAAIVEKLKRDNAVQSQKTTASKIELEQTKAAFERDRLEYEKEITAHKDELVRLQMELENRKTTTAYVKTGGDNIKYGIGLATAVVGLVTFVWSAVSA